MPREFYTPVAKLTHQRVRIDEGSIKMLNGFSHLLGFLLVSALGQKETSQAPTHPSEKCQKQKLAVAEVHQNFGHHQLLLPQ